MWPTSSYEFCGHCGRATYHQNGTCQERHAPRVLGPWVQRQLVRAVRAFNLARIKFVAWWARRRAAVWFRRTGGLSEGYAIRALSRRQAERLGYTSVPPAKGWPAEMPGAKRAENIVQPIDRYFALPWR